MAALILAGTSSAQSTGDDALTGSLDLSPPLDSGDLFSGLMSSGGGSPGPGGVSLVHQQGTGNSTAITQTGPGYGALAVVVQSGIDNSADITQCNCGNFAGILQDGNANLSEVSQTGSGNVFLHQQYGDGLSLSVAQYGGAHISITQTGP